LLQVQENLALCLAFCFSGFAKASTGCTNGVRRGIFSVGWPGQWKSEEQRKGGLFSVGGFQEYRFWLKSTEIRYSVDKSRADSTQKTSDRPNNIENQGGAPLFRYSIIEYQVFCSDFDIFHKMETIHARVARIYPACSNMRA